MIAPQAARLHAAAAASAAAGSMVGLSLENHLHQSPREANIDKMQCGCAI